MNTVEVNPVANVNFKEDPKGPAAHEEPQSSPPSTTETLELTAEPQTLVNGESQSDGEVQPESVPKPRLCGVCNENEGRYRCARCYLRYCSVACSKSHKSTHADDEHSRPKVEKPTSPPRSNGTVPRPGTKAAAGYKSPLAALEDSKELKELFKIYPNLHSQLDEIDTATLRPLDGELKPIKKGTKVEPWNPDRGIEKGREALSKARNTSGEEGRAVREFSRLVLQILAGDDGVKAADVIEKERREESYKAIEALLNNER